MDNLGYRAPDSTVYVEFDTFNSNGGSVTLTGLAVTDIEIYKDGGTTQRASDNGYALLDTDGIDFDGITGIHGLSIDLSDNSDAGFYASGSHYRVVLSTITVDGQTVSFTAATFDIGYQSVDAVAISGDTTAADNLESACDNYSATRGLAGTALPAAAADGAGGLPISDAGGLDLDTLLGYLTAAVATSAELAKVPKSDGTTSWNATALASINAEADTAISDASLATAAQATAIEADTQDIQSRLPAALVNSRMDSTVDGTGMESGATAAIAAALNNISAADVNAQVLDVLATDVFTELSSLPDLSSGNGASIKDMVVLLCMTLLHKVDVTSAGAKEIHQSDGTLLGTKTITDDGTDYSESKMA